MSLETLTQSEIENKTFWLRIGRKARTVGSSASIFAGLFLPGILSSCQPEEANPTAYVLESKNSSPDGALVMAWKDGIRNKSTIRNGAFSISHPNSITYDSITAEKNGYEKFFKGKTKVDGNVTLDIYLVENGEYTTKFHITSNNEFFEDKLYKNLPFTAQEVFDKNIPTPEGNTLTWSVKKNKKWEILSEITIPENGNVSLPLYQRNSELDTYLLEIKGQNIHPITQEFSGVTSEENEATQIDLAARFWAAMEGNVGPVRENNQSKGILLYMQHKNGVTELDDMIMGLSKGGTPSIESSTYIFLDIMNEYGSLREGVNLIDGKIVFEAQVGMYKPHIEENPELIKEGWQPNYELQDVTIEDVFIQNKIYTDMDTYPHTRIFNISYPLRDVNFQDFSIITRTEAGDTVVNAGGEMFSVNSNKYIPLFVTQDGITTHNGTYVEIPLARNEEDRYDSPQHWVATKNPSIDARLLATSTMKVLKDGALTTWGAPNSLEVITEGTFTLQREDEPYKEDEYGRKIYRTTGTITIPNTYEDFKNQD